MADSRVEWMKYNILKDMLADAVEDASYGEEDERFLIFISPDLEEVRAFSAEDIPEDLSEFIGWHAEIALPDDDFDEMANKYFDFR